MDAKSKFQIFVCLETCAFFISLNQSITRLISFQKHDEKTTVFRAQCFQEFGPRRHSIPMKLNDWLLVEVALLLIGLTKISSTKSGFDLPFVKKLPLNLGLRVLLAHLVLAVTHGRKAKRGKGR